MVEIGRFGSAVAISITHANVFAISRRSGAVVDFTGIDDAVEPVYKNRNNIVIGVTGSPFVASAFSGLFCCCTAGGACSFVISLTSFPFEMVQQFHNI